MKNKFTFIVFFLMALSFTARTQDDTIRSLVISEASTAGGFYTQVVYVELANRGTEAVNLKNFELGSNAWTLCTNFQTPKGYYAMLPDTLIQPGETFLLSDFFNVGDEHPELHITRTLPDFLEKTDLPVHRDELLEGDDGGIDSISEYHRVLPIAEGWCVYLEFHIGGDSAMVDGIFIEIDPATGRINSTVEEAKAVAGFPHAWGDNNVLVRKSTVTQGNFNWEDSRGTNPDDSEWLVIPARTNTAGYANRYFTTIAHDGNVVMKDAVASDNITIDWDNSKMTVPWGIYRDSIMFEYNLGDGIAWHLDLSSNSVEDSTHNIVVTGDSLTLYAVGATLDEKKFLLEQAAPAEDMNLVFPKNYPQRNDEGEIVGWNTPFYVTQDQPDMDSVGSIPFRTRVDTLFKYLEKADNASWEITWIDGTERPDLVYGDILKVTASGGTEKNYFLSVDEKPEPSHNADLGAITWPDAPTYVRDNPAWVDDTIPGFNPSVHMYNVSIPYGTKAIPALKAIPQSLNASITMDRAILLEGTVKDRTTTFVVTAEDDSTIVEYSVTFSVEKPSNLIQPFTPDPFISEVVSKAWRQNAFIEVTNPGNQPLDLSNYMFIRGWVGQDPVAMFSTQHNYYNRRFEAYIPGYDYQSEIEWNVTPDLIEKDLSVNPMLGPGESFAVADIRSGSGGWIYNENVDFFLTNQVDLQDNREEAGTEDAKVMDYTRDNISTVHNLGFIGHGAGGTSWHIYKILNDSIKTGKKGLGDMADFELIDVFGQYDGTNWAPGGTTIAQVHNNRFRRKPNIWKGNTLPGMNGSFGTTPEECEWDYTDWIMLAAELGLSSQYDAERFMAENIGVHAMDVITVYVSTIGSYEYKVSDGYKSMQSIEGVSSGTTVADFLGKINKNDDNQVLEVLHRINTDVILDKDTLMVTSADGENVTKYEITLGALDSNAKLTSSAYDIVEDGSTGTISGISIGTSIQDVRNMVIKPNSASLNIIDKNNNLVPFQIRNYKDEYVNTKATSNIFFEVIAEDGVTKILYQLMPTIADDEAYLFSDVFEVDQDLQLISLIPDGIRVDEFFANISVNQGAGATLNNKVGSEVVLGNVAFDDVVIVTSPDESTTKVYSLEFMDEAKGADAYVLSDVFVVDQFALSISEIQRGLQVNIFRGLLKPAQGATVTLLDADGNIKTSGEVIPGDQIQVVSGNGVLTVIYELEFIVSVESDQTDPRIRAYPNPTKNVMFIEGINGSSLVEVRNILGSVVRKMNVENQDMVEFQFKELPAGVYFINIFTDTNKESVTLKVFKQ